MRDKRNYFRNKFYHLTLRFRETGNIRTLLKLEFYKKCPNSHIFLNSGELDKELDYEKLNAMLEHYKSVRNAFVESPIYQNCCLIQQTYVKINEFVKIPRTLQFLEALENVIKQINLILKTVDESIFLREDFYNPALNIFPPIRIPTSIHRNEICGKIFSTNNLLHERICRSHFYEIFKLIKRFRKSAPYKNEPLFLALNE